MSVDLAPLHSYVRFYQAVVAQITAAWANLARTHELVKGALDPFAAPLAELRSPLVVAAIRGATSPPEALRALWIPEDPDALTGLTDVYEVVGRFRFEGDDAENLARVQELVSGARNEIVTQRARLADMRKLPEAARATAARLQTEESSRARSRHAEQEAAFAPLAEMVMARARQTIDAVRSVATPSLQDAKTAPEEYQRHIAKIDQFYQTCLPFLRKAIAALYAFVGADAPTSYPDALPLVRELPAELINVPPADSAELSQARSTLQSLSAEETELVRAKTELASALLRIEGDLAAGQAKDSEAIAEIEAANLGVDYVALVGEAEAARQAHEGLEQQKAQRMALSTEIWGRHKQAEATIETQGAILCALQAQITETEKRLEEERDDEPVLFGKDDWSGRVAAIDAKLAELRHAEAQRLAMLNQLKFDLSSLSVQLQAEQAQIELCDRWMADARAKQDKLQKALGDLGARLGAARPSRATTLAEAHQATSQTQERRAEIAARLDRSRAEVRRIKEETVRLLSRQKQIDVERQHARAMVESAEVAATQGRDEAARQLAAQRKAAVEQHVNEVLGGLEASLASAETIFIEPAREALRRANEGAEALSAAVAACAVELAPIVEELHRDLDPELLAQDATLSQIQREFCDAAPSACRAAWGST